MDQPLTLGEMRLIRASVDLHELEYAQTEDAFMTAAVELAKETGQIVTVLACSHRLDEACRPRHWDRNEAIVGGLVVRLSKLIRATLDQVCQRRLEIAHLLFRCLAETAINVRFLLQEDREDLYDEYVTYSLRQEKKLLSRIEANIAERGTELPIESRMKVSVLQAFRVSGVEPGDVDEEDRSTWGGSIYKRAKSVGLEDAYLALFNLGSHVVHGNWQDLLHYHLNKDHDGFVPVAGWSCPRPQLLLTACRLAVDACSEFIAHILPPCDDRTDVEERLGDLIARIKDVDRLHERYVAAKTGNGDRGKRSGSPPASTGKGGC